MDLLPIIGAVAALAIVYLGYKCIQISNAVATLDKPIQTEEFKDL
jgi:hypothetical protein